MAVRRGSEQPPNPGFRCHREPQVGHSDSVAPVSAKQRPRRHRILSGRPHVRLRRGKRLHSSPGSRWNGVVRLRHFARCPRWARLRSERVSLRRQRPEQPSPEVRRRWEFHSGVGQRWSSRRTVRAPDRHRVLTRGGRIRQRHGQSPHPALRCERDVSGLLRPGRQFRRRIGPATPAEHASLGQSSGRRDGEPSHLRVHHGWNVRRELGRAGRRVRTVRDSLWRRGRRPGGRLHRGPREQPHPEVRLRLGVQLVCAGRRCRFREHGIFDGRVHDRPGRGW